MGIVAWTKPAITSNAIQSELSLLLLASFMMMNFFFFSHLLETSNAAHCSAKRAMWDRLLMV
jgi:hypothetical protein